MSRTSLEPSHIGQRREALRQRSPNIVPYTAYAASDGMIAIAVGTTDSSPKSRRSRASPMGWRLRYAKNPERVANRRCSDAAITNGWRHSAEV